MEGLANMAITIPTVYIARSIDWNAENLLFLRIGFAILHLMAFLILGYVWLQIQATPNEKKIMVPKKQPSIMNTEPVEEEEMTIQDYDKKEFMTLLSGTAFPILIIGFIHYKFETAVPLATQFAMLPMRIWQAKLFQIYVLGRTGPEYTRPFKQPENPLASMMGAAAPEQPKKKAAKAKKDN